MDYLHDFTVNFAVKDKKNRKGLFFILSGPSGVGKNTLLYRALKRLAGIYYLPSITTRSLRPGEKQGFPYYFISKELFKKMIAADVFLEWKQIHTGNYYGTHLPTVTYALANGYDILTDMDVLGCLEVMERYPANVISIFIAPPSIEELRRRLLKRGGEPQAINKRLERVAMEMGYVDKYRYMILNDDLARASNELVQIIKKYSRTYL